MGLDKFNFVHAKSDFIFGVSELFKSMLAWTSLVLTASAASAHCPNLGAAPRLPVSAAGYEKIYRHSLREDGVLVFDYGGEYNNLGKHPDPYFISVYALSLYRDWLNTKCQDEVLLNKFMIQARFLASSAEWRGDMAVWSHPFENSFYHLDPGWISGIGQARIASALYRAYAVTQDKQFKLTADGAMLTYLRPLTEGGVVTIEDHVTWIEEAPDPKGRSYKILNGHLTALSGILDVWRITKDPRWRTILERGVDAVRRDIAKFDAGFSSAYSLGSPSDKRPIAARKDYNVLHVSQLLWLYELDGDPTFLYWASRFQAYEMNADKYSAMHSIDPKNHGPDQVAALYYDRYWSSSSLPVSFTITLTHARLINRIAIDGHTLETSPSDFDTSLLLNGASSWSTRTSGNSDKNIDIKIDPPVMANEVRIDFTKTVSDEILAINAIAAVRAQPEFAPVSSECNYRPDSTYTPLRYNVDRAFDGDTNSKMMIYCAGYIVFPVPEGKSTFWIDADHDRSEKVTYQVSDSMKRWSRIRASNIDAPIRIPPNAKFVMIRHSGGIKSINEIRFNRLMPKDLKSAERQINRYIADKPSDGRGRTRY